MDQTQPITQNDIPAECVTTLNLLDQRNLATPPNVHFSSQGRTGDDRALKLCPLPGRSRGSEVRKLPIYDSFRNCTILIYQSAHILGQTGTVDEERQHALLIHSVPRLSQTQPVAIESLNPTKVYL